MIAIEQLSYVRLGTRDLKGAVDFAQRILGLQLVERTDAQAAFRSDFRDHTLVYVEGDPSEQAVGVEVRDATALENAVAVVSDRGYAIVRGTPDECAVRKVKSFVTFTGASGNRTELVVRPLHSGWRYFPERDAGITGLEAVALRSTKAGADEDLWTTLLGARVSDWVGDAAYISFDGCTHHRLAIHPSDRHGVLAVEYGVENVDLLMQNSYFLQSAQVRTVHGPGRRPTSGQLFLTFMGPDGVLFSLVTEGNCIKAPDRRPRQFPRTARSWCSWGSVSQVPEFSSH